MIASVQAQGVAVTLDSSRIIGEIDLSIEPGEWVALIGPNGAGKTTLLRALAGLVAAEGSVLIAGRRYGPRRRRELARMVALVPQLAETPPALTVAEYVLLGRTPHIGYLGTESDRDRAVAAAAIDRLGLREFVERPLGTLSGGERQRVVLARALAQAAPIVLLDEPTSALDLGRQQEALELLDTLRRQDGLTVLSAMHDLTLAGQYADRLVLLDRGRVASIGTPDEVLTPETIGRCYGAEVRVLREQGRVFVLPVRSGPC